jgi:small conductance mechanosensitive channel
MDKSISRYAEVAWTWIADHGLRIAVILVLMYTGIRLSHMASSRLFAFLGRRKAMDDEYKKRADTLSAVIGYVISATIITIAALTILVGAGYQDRPGPGGRRRSGVAVGFGAQHLVQDVISGFFILLDDEIRVGDVVEIAGKSGLVERLNLRMVVLRDLGATCTTSATA